MPLKLHLRHSDDFQIAFWHLEETLEELQSTCTLTPADEAEFIKLNHEKRKREWLASRAALRIGLASAESVQYAPTGKPKLESSEMSLSHCLPIAGALIHPTHAGMDIQIPDEKIGRIRTKFAHPEERGAAEQSDRELDYLTILWSAKEALFKVYGQGLHFAEQIRIDQFKVGQRELTATVHREGKSIQHQLSCFQLMGHWVVYVC
ncbi:MAG: 4'-phosphopantetheinyl transferase superfamily protein [Flavobacteriales bacterium]|nr:4'-phosphopantetheinyl transferase superfamily protein [Flavobacteriales bacterium]